MSPFHRNQKRIDRIGYLIQEISLLEDKEIHQLAHDCGDMEDAAVELSRSLDDLQIALKEFETNPKRCLHAFLAFAGWFEEFRMHMNSAEELIMKVCRVIRRRHPDMLPDESE